MSASRPSTLPLPSMSTPHHRHYLYLTSIHRPHPSSCLKASNTVSLSTCWESGPGPCSRKTSTPGQISCYRVSLRIVIPGKKLKVENATAALCRMPASRPPPPCGFHSSVLLKQTQSPSEYHYWEIHMASRETDLIRITVRPCVRAGVCVYV